MRVLVNHNPTSISIIYSTKASLTKKRKVKSDQKMNESKQKISSKSFNLFGLCSKIIHFYSKKSKSPKIAVILAKNRQKIASRQQYFLSPMRAQNRQLSDKSPFLVTLIPRPKSCGGGALPQPNVLFLFVFRFPFSKPIIGRSNATFLLGGQEKYCNSPAQGEILHIRKGPALCLSAIHIRKLIGSIGVKWGGLGEELHWQRMR